MSLLLTSLPEELLERILALAILPSSFSNSPPAALQASLPRSTSAPFPFRSSSQTLLPRTTSLRSPPATEHRVHRYTQLLVNRLFARIGSAVLYTRIHLSSSTQCAALARTLFVRKDLALRVKNLRLEGVWPEFLELAQSLNLPGGSLQVFDMSISAAQRHSAEHGLSATATFCEALKILPTLGTIKSLTIRKTADAYLTLPGPASIIECMSDLMERWDTLETIHIGFRLLSGPRHTVGSPMLSDAIAPPSPCAKFVSALSRAPSLRVVSSQLPAAWNSSLLEISSNPSLTAIQLEPSPPVAGPHHLFLVEASKYPRLDELIRAGSPPAPHASTPRRRSDSLRIMVTPSCGSGRLRANTTLGTPSPSPSAVNFPSMPYTADAGAMLSAGSPITTVSGSGSMSATVQTQFSRRKSTAGKGHTRQTTKWSRRGSVV